MFRRFRMPFRIFRVTFTHMKPKKIIVANWKMNPRTLREARSIFQRTKWRASHLTNVQTVICPPLVFLGALYSNTTTACALGAQDVFWKNTQGGVGAYTGKVSPTQLYSLGVSHVILGHSEQRALGETNEMIQKKIKASFEYR